MKGRPAPVRPMFLLLFALACLCAAAPARRADAQAEEVPSAGTPNQQAGTTRKLDEYGKIGHCDETARLDNFAIELQNEPGSNGYLVVYVGKDDLPSWTDGILKRAAGYLVESRGMDAGRIKVVNGGYREQRTTELWVVPENDPPPQPSNTVEFKLDRTKSYKWDEDSFNIEFNYDDPEAAETEEEEGADSEEAESSVATEKPAAGQTAEAQSAEGAAWKKEVEKYEIATVARGVIESESDPEGSGADETEADDGAADEASAEPEGPPETGEVKISLWWNVERLADELKAAPGARLCLVYYWGVKNATQERVKEIVERALAKTEEQLGLKRDRIIVIDGGRSTDPGLELWVVPPGAETPRPRPEQRRNFGFYSSPGEE